MTETQRYVWCTPPLGGWVALFFLLFSSNLFAQEKPIQGIVFDKDSKQRLTRVYIYNTRLNKGFYNNGKGEFYTSAKEGDILVAALQGYGVDTASVGAQNTILFYLKRTSIMLPQVTVTDTVTTPKSKLKENQQEYKDAYIKGNTKDMLNIGSTGAGLNITSLYNLLSKQGKNARQLQRIIERDYREAIIEYRYTHSLVSTVTGLTGVKLDDFMQQYRPTYYFVLESNDYEMISFIKSSYQQYTRNPAALRLPPLKTEP